MSDIIEADKEALSIYSSQKSNIPLRSNLDIPEYKGQCLFIHGGFKPVEYEKDGVKHHVIILTASSWESPFD